MANLFNQSIWTLMAPKANAQETDANQMMSMPPPTTPGAASTPSPDDMTKANVAKATNSVLKQSGIPAQSAKKIESAVKKQADQSALQSISHLDPKQQADLIRSRMDQMAQQTSNVEQAGVDDYQKSINDYAAQKQDVDLRPLAGLLDMWGGKGDHLSKIAEGQVGEDSAAKQKNLMAMKQQLQAMKSGMSKEQYSNLKSQLDSYNEEIKLQSAEARARASLDVRGGNQSNNNEKVLRSEWLKNSVTKDTQDVASAFNKVQKAANDPSAAGDLSLIFGYMKMLDPGSTVREGEFANAQNAAGIPDQVRNMWNRAKNGERLNSSQREDFLNQANNVYSAQMDQQNKFNDSIKSVAKAKGVDEKNVVLDHMFSPSAPTKAPVKSSGLTPEEQAELDSLKALKAGQ